MKEKTRNPVGEGAITFVLLALMLSSVTASVETANWADGLEILTFAAVAGLIVGVLIAKLPIKGYLAHPLMLILGVPVVAVLASTLLPDVLLFNEKLIVLFERFIVWMSKATLGGVSTDNLMFVVQCAFFAWIMAYLAAWFVYRRHQVWGAVLPTGFAMVFNLFYAVPQPPLYFTLFILAALLLVIRLNLQSMEEWWRRTSVGYSNDISFDFLSYGAAFSVAFMLLAWSLPTSDPGSTWLSALEPLQGPWAKAEDQFNRVFGSLRAVARPADSAYFGSSLIMGGPVKLGNKPVMDVQSDLGRYFRATTYDKYTGIGWLNTHQDAINVGTNDSRLFDQMRDYGRVVITQTFTLYEQEQNILYVQSDPVLFDTPVELRYGTPLDSGSSAPMDLAAVRSRKTLKPGDKYSVISTVSVADMQSLRDAYTDYTPWIRSNYLQLPDTLPERVRTLADQITKPYKNPYDKAVALEQYLRAKIKYNDLVTEPPQGRDGVDYTLFDRPEGYCNYYASAMAVMARAVGIPARVVSGYSMGQYRNGIFHVVEANAHAWVEVYFPGYGWIEFEPTSSQPEILRSEKPAAPLENDPALEEDVKNARRFPNKNLDDTGDIGAPGGFEFGTPTLSDPRTVGIAGGALLLLVALGSVAALRWKRSRRQMILAPAAGFYERIQARARWLGLPDEHYATPFERARVIGDALPNVREDISATTQLYVREKFGARPLDKEERNSLALAWYRVRREWRHGVLKRVVYAVVEPPRRFFTGIGRAIERWGQG